jgi:hypothetical protein
MYDELIFQTEVLDPEAARYGWVPVFARHIGAMRDQEAASRGINPSILSVLFPACMIINFLDVASTAAGLLASPGVREQNYLAQSILSRLGFIGGIAALSLIKMGIPLGLYLFLRQGRPWYRGAFFIGLCINTSAVLCAVANNCGVFFAMR